MAMMLRDHCDVCMAPLGPSRRLPMSAADFDFALGRRRMGASWDAIGRMLGRHGEDVRRACEEVHAP